MLRLRWHSCRVASSASSSTADNTERLENSTCSITCQLLNTGVNVVGSAVAVSRLTCLPRPPASALLSSATAAASTHNKPALDSGRLLLHIVRVTDVSRTIWNPLECSCSKINDELSCAPCRVRMLYAGDYLFSLHNYFSFIIVSVCVAFIFHLIITTKFTLYPLL